MIGLDTNVVVRYLTQDDPQQSPVATNFMEHALRHDEPGYISLVVLAELVWVLTSVYKLDRAQVADVIGRLLTTHQLRIEAANIVWLARRRYERSNADFSDALILECSIAAGCDRAVTFDRNAARTSGFELLQ